MKSILILCVIILALSGCKKYEADESRMFQSPEKRIIGDWTVTSYLIDDVEYIDSLKARWGICWGEPLTFTDESGLLMLTDSCYSLGGYAFPDKKKKFLTTGIGVGGVKNSGYSAAAEFNIPGTIQFAFLDVTHWEILQLDQTRLVLKCTYFHSTQTFIAQRNP